MRRKIFPAGALLIVLALAGIQAVRPERTNPVVTPAAHLTARERVTPEVSAVFQRACNDCHSNRTRWPWYSNVAPVSWFVIDHVNHGRRHLNFSEWSGYDAERRETLIRNICKQTSRGAMPMPSYLLMHRTARLVADDVRTLCTWTEGLLGGSHGGSGEGSDGGADAGSSKGSN